MLVVIVLRRVTILVIAHENWVKILLTRGNFEGCMKNTRDDKGGLSSNRDYRENKPSLDKI